MGLAVFSSLEGEVEGLREATLGRALGHGIEVRVRQLLVSLSIAGAVLEEEGGEGEREPGEEGESMMAEECERNCCEVGKERFRGRGRQLPLWLS